MNGARDEASALRSDVQSAATLGDLTADAAKNIEHWLELPLEPDQSRHLAQMIRDKDWEALEQSFWQVLPFGTAGRRGRMVPIGTATINRRTIGETVQALANYVRRISSHTESAGLCCAVGYDCRHHSREFAEMSAEIMVAAGFQIYFLDQMRPTPELALTVRQSGCPCGIMITASHNPPSDNAIKVFWSHGGQICEPHDHALTLEIEEVRLITRIPFAKAVADGQVIACTEEMDAAYAQAVLQQGYPGRRALRVLFSPLQGVGGTSIESILRCDGFADVQVYAPHARPDPDFSKVPHQIANPESPEVFEALMEHGKQLSADLILASDPDADRIGCAAPLQLGGSAWDVLTGNQIGVLLGEFILRNRQTRGTLSPDHYLVKTIVTSDMLTAIGAAFGVRVHGNVLTGFKWISNTIQRFGEDLFVFGMEEAHGYLAGNYIQDKDGAVAAMLLAERAAQAKAAGLSLHEELDELYRRYGCFQELAVSKAMPGASGMDRMRAIMDDLRTKPPQALGGMGVDVIWDYLRGFQRLADGSEVPHELPRGDVLVYELDRSGFRVAVRPSGTEPKIKWYLFGWSPPMGTGELIETKLELRERLLQVFDDLMRHSGLAFEVA